MTNEKVANSQDKYLSDKLDEEDYKEVKRISKSKIEKLELDIQQIVSESKELDIKTKIKNARFYGESFKPLPAGRFANKKDDRGVDIS